MALFTRILDFKRDFLARLRNKRSQPRHRVGAEFPLKATINLVGSASPGKKGAPAGSVGCYWSGRVGDISTNGLNLMLPPAAATARGESTIVRLNLENHELQIPCIVAHFRILSSYALCGLQLKFDDFKSQKAYLQLVEAVNLGASFVPSGQGSSGRTPAGFVRRTWRSVNKTELTDWRVAESRALDRFELTLGEHSVQGQKARLGLDVLHRSGKTKPVHPDVAGEVRQLFRWVVGNLPKSVPADLRELMTKVSSAPPAPLTAPPPAPKPPSRASVPPMSTGPKPMWQPPKSKQGAPA